jgi:DNA invertase Pin-like site-specific DNA recombinase
VAIRGHRRIPSSSGSPRRFGPNWPLVATYLISSIRSSCTFYAALSEKQRAMISQRTKAALAASALKGYASAPQITAARAKGTASLVAERRPYAIILVREESA